MLNKNVCFFAFAMFALLFVTSCGEDETLPMTTSSEFTVTLENIASGKSYFETGTTGLIMPGETLSYSFNAGKGNRLSFATMYVQSNDLFFAPDEDGIALYDASGTPTTGDLNGFIQLWDSGTEVNEEPGVGANQAPRQTGPDTGMEENGTVQPIGAINDGFTYPEISDLVAITLSHNGGTEFMLTLSNVSGSSAIPSPLAPGVWVVHSEGQNPLFTVGENASEGIENIAEDGNNAIANTELMANTGFVTPYAPGAYSIGDNILFTTATASSAALEALAEDGDPSGFSNVFNTPIGAAAPAPIFPGESYSFTFTAEDGDKLSLATMLIQSNDWFVGADEVELFVAGAPVAGDITSMLKIYDSGTEEDEYAGAGNNQAPRQSGGNTGVAENGLVEVETAVGAHVPALTELLKVTISSN